MVLMRWLNIASWLIPVSGLTMAIQSLAALFYPTSELGYQFLENANDLFMLELIMMHSSIFWYMRSHIANSKIIKFFFGLFLIFAYSLFIIPIAQKDPIVGFNYFSFCILRLFFTEKDHWFKTFDLHYAVKPKDITFIYSMLSLFKAFYFALFLSMLAYFLEWPKTALTYELVANLFPNVAESSSILINVRTLALYFISLLLFEIYIFYRKLHPRPVPTWVEKQPVGIKLNGIFKRNRKKTNNKS